MKRSFKNILAMVMVATMVFGNSFCVSAHEVEPYASCAHSFGNWQFYKTTYKPGPNVEDCNIRVTHYVRVCSKCGETETKTSEYQMTHAWGTLDNGWQKCLNCGQVKGTLR